MRPIKLTIQGFTSFAERTEIDFADLDLFAITGPTGSGKTSVLDAMTWALYGSTPRLGKCGAELISHGKASLAVHFEFAAAATRYRITRTAKRSGTGQVRLEKLRDCTWVPEEASGLRETNAAICKVVGLEFDAFKLSVILPQGEFDGFLRGDHADRRKILKSLLGLQVYERMREPASSRCQDLRARETAEQAVIDRDYANATEDHLKEFTADLGFQKKAFKENGNILEHAERVWTLANRIETDRSLRITKATQRSNAETEFQKACNAAKSAASEVQRLQQKI